MTDGSRVLVNLQVSEKQKQKWQLHVENSPEHKSLSQFIRFVVEREIGGHTSNGGGGLSGDADERLSELSEDNRQLNAKLDGMANTVERIEDRLDEPSGEIRELASDAFDVLPYRDSIGDSQGRPRQSHVKADSGQGTVEAIAERLDTDDYSALQALDLLERDMSMVRKGNVFNDGETRYYRDEDEYEVR